MRHLAIIVLTWVLSVSGAQACIRLGNDVLDELEFLLCLHNEQVDALNQLSRALNEAEQRAYRAEVLFEAQDQALTLVVRRINDLEARLEALE